MKMLLLAMAVGATAAVTAAATVNVLDFREAAIMDTFGNGPSYSPPTLDLSKKTFPNTTRARKTTTILR